MLRQQEKVTSVESVLTVATRQEQLEKLASGQKKDEEKSKGSASLGSTSCKRFVPFSCANSTLSRALNNPYDSQNPDTGAPRC